MTEELMTEIKQVLKDAEQGLMSADLPQGTWMKAAFDPKFMAQRMRDLHDKIEAHAPKDGGET